MAAPASARAAEECKGFLFKLKENNKEWKKLYVVLKGAEIIYYDSPNGHQADKRLKDGVKQVITSYPYDEFTGVNAPTGTPAYFIIETTHAKKTYCAKSQEDRATWVNAIRHNGEMFARQSMSKSGDRPNLGRANTPGKLLGKLTQSKFLSLIHI